MQASMQAIRQLALMYEGETEISEATIAANNNELYSQYKQAGKQAAGEYMNDCAGQMTRQDRTDWQVRQKRVERRERCHKELDLARWEMSPACYRVATCPCVRCTAS
jgi:hypothetical protein